VQIPAALGACDFFRKRRRAQDYILGNSQPSLRDWSVLSNPTQDYVLGYSQPSLRDSEARPYLDATKRRKSKITNSPNEQTFSEGHGMVQSLGAGAASSPTSRKKREIPGFPARGLSDGRACGFHRGKPHETYERHQTSQEIRGMGHPHRWQGQRVHYGL
jgi:hypothetical protein